MPILCMQLFSYEKDINMFRVYISGVRRCLGMGGGGYTMSQSREVWEDAPPGNFLDFNCSKINSGAI